MSAEPTAEQWETAMVACGHRGWTTEQLSLTQRERVNNVALALAAAYRQGYNECHFDGHVSGGPQ